LWAFDVEGLCVGGCVRFGRGGEEFCLEVVGLRLGGGGCLFLGGVSAIRGFSGRGGGSGLACGFCLCFMSVYLLFGLWQDWRFVFFL